MTTKKNTSFQGQISGMRKTAVLRDVGTIRHRYRVGELSRWGKPSANELI
jgi:hypothetical protein